MQKYFDEFNNRLVYIGNLSDSSYWDKHWQKTKLKMEVDPFIVNTTKKQLPIGAYIIEGGCGLGNKVYSLNKAGYQSVGVDFAEDTVSMIKSQFPELDIQFGDVRSLNFPDKTFDGYWSLGVIEHFYEGYLPILHEMKRVLKDSGILFMTVPNFSPLRKLKARLGLYPRFTDEISASSKDKFYQFAISKEEIISTFCSQGFELVSHKKLDGLKGFKDEFPLGKLLQPIYENSSVGAKIIRKILNKLLSPFAPHICLYIFRKI